MGDEYDTIKDFFDDLIRCKHIVFETKEERITIEIKVEDLTKKE